MLNEQEPNSNEADAICLCSGSIDEFSEEASVDRPVQWSEKRSGNG